MRHENVNSFSRPVTLTLKLETQTLGMTHCPIMTHPHTKFEINQINSIEDMSETKRDRRIRGQVNPGKNPSPNFVMGGIIKQSSVFISSVLWGSMMGMLKMSRLCTKFELP